MSGGRHDCFITFFAHNALLLLGVWSQALGAYSCKQQYGRVEETFVLSPGSISEPLLVADWKFNLRKVTNIKGVMSGHQLSDRLSLDLKTYSLTIRDLRTADSGDFTFVSSKNVQEQRPTICIRLSVQEVLTESPRLTVFNITKPSNESCVALMECSSSYDKDVSYRWTVNNVRKNGSTLQYQMKPHDRDTTVTCTVSNSVSETSTNTSINCQSPPSPIPQGTFVGGIIIIAGVIFAVLVAFVVFVGVCRYKKSHAAEANDELTVYAEIDDTSSKIMKPCSVYETLEHVGPTVKSQPPQTVYDKIQFNRMQQPQNKQREHGPNRL